MKTRINTFLNYYQTDDFIVFLSSSNVIQTTGKHNS